MCPLAFAFFAHLHFICSPTSWENYSPIDYVCGFSRCDFPDGTENTIATNRLYLLYFIFKKKKQKNAWKAQKKRTNLNLFVIRSASVQTPPYRPLQSVEIVCWLRHYYVYLLMQFQNTSAKPFYIQIVLILRWSRNGAGKKSHLANDLLNGVYCI